MCSILKRAKNGITMLLWGSGTEWHEFSMAAILYGYGLWCILFGQAALENLHYMSKLMPPIGWAAWFTAAAVLKTVGLTTRHTRLRIIGSWLGTLTWAFMFAQFLRIEQTNWLGLPTFAALTLTNGWLVIRNAVTMDREKRGSTCKPSLQ